MALIPEHTQRAAAPKWLSARYGKWTGEDISSREGGCERCGRDCSGEVPDVLLNYVCSDCNPKLHKQWAKQGYSRMHPIIDSWGQWHVTTYGLECKSPFYSIEMDRLFECQHGRSWGRHMAEKIWVKAASFAKAWSEAIDAFRPILTPKPEEVACVEAELAWLRVHASDIDRQHQEERARPIVTLDDVEILSLGELSRRKRNLMEKPDVVRFHQEGNNRSISTNAQREDAFLREVEVALSQRVQSEGELATGWLRPIVDICCALRGYKSDVTKHQIIVAGEWIPSDVIDAIVKR